MILLDHFEEKLDIATDPVETRTMVFVELFMLLVAIGACAADDCPEKYRQFSNEHTFCQPANAQCQVQKGGLQQADIQEILRVHNEYRSRAATGKESRLPSSSRMLEMVWDTELASIAQKHAELCEFEHDCDECRRVPNFEVGQNLFESRLSGSKVSPKSNWTEAVEGWYDEIEIFDRSYINPFIPSEAPEDEPTYGHFSQVMWGESWRVGCGYVKHKDGEEEIVQLYTCNYGPAGNIEGGAMYEEGKPCTRCPQNSCCGGSCSKFPGLCKMLKDEAPRDPAPSDATFYCNFNGEEDCAYSVTEGAKKWQVQSTLSGNFLGVVLKGGESSTVTFQRQISGKSGICFGFTYSKGPVQASGASSHTALHRYRPSSTVVEKRLRDGPASDVKFSMGLGWDEDTEVSFSFSVPKGAPPQFFRVRELKAKNGKC